MKKRLYLDTAAGLNNPSSIHREGVLAAKKLNVARKQVANFLGAQPDEIVFTSGGTESNNLAIFGVAGRMITSLIEHPSIINAGIKLEGAGIQVDYLPVGLTGLIDPKLLAKKLTPETKLVSLSYGNSEIGVVQPVAEIAKVIRRYRKNFANHNHGYPYFHLDACQATRFLELKVRKLGVDLLTLNGGKIYGSESSGLLFVRRGIKLKPMLVGGGQENGRRAGTENLPAILSLAKAVALCEKLRVKESARLIKLRDYFIERLLKIIPNTVLNGDATARLPHNINVSFLDTDSEYVVLALDAKGVAVSSGSACSTKSESASYVLKALGADLAAVVADNRARSAVRFTLARETTKADLNYVLKILPPIITRARFINHEV